MNIEELRAYCLSKPFEDESFPFDENTLVFKVADKIFALTGLEHFPPAVNLKCNPERAIELRERNEAILPGFHMNKRHWNTIQYGGLAENLVKELIDHSYSLVLQSLTKEKQRELGMIS